MLGFLSPGNVSIVSVSRFCAIRRYKQAEIFDGDTFRDQTHDFLGSRQHTNSYLYLPSSICAKRLHDLFWHRVCVLNCYISLVVFSHHFGNILSLYMGPCLGPHLCQADCCCLSPDWFTLSFDIWAKMPYKQTCLPLTYMKLNMNCTKCIQICETHSSIHANWFCPAYIHMACI